MCDVVCFKYVCSESDTLQLYYYVDGKRIGCGFVQYSSVFDASRAIKRMNGQKIQGMYNV